MQGLRHFSQVRQGAACSLPCIDLRSMSQRLQINKIDPPAGIAGGEVAVEYDAVAREVARDLTLSFNGIAAHVTALGRRRALVTIPEIHTDGPITVSARSGDETASAPVSFTGGKKLAGGLHPVANPAFDPEDGSLYVTRSGSRGERVPVSIFRIDSDGAVQDFSSDIVNPTSIAFGRTGRMFVTSRFDGSVLRVNADHDAISFVSELGVATGLAFNRDGDMFVGDRGGTIFRINEIGEAQPWAQHEPSVSAYHLAFGPDDALYVTGPTVSSFDSITRFDENGHASGFYQGLGRPQGLAFDTAGNLYVAASLRGRRGIVRIPSDGNNAELVVAGTNLVGLAFGPKGEMVVASNEAVLRLPMGIYGTLLS